MIDRILPLIGIVLFVMGICVVQWKHNFISHACTATGKVLDAERRMVFTGRTVVPITVYTIRFITQTGNIITTRTQAWNLHVGTEVRMLYNPNNPMRAMPENAASTNFTIMAALFLITGGMFFLAGMLTMLLPPL